MLFQKIIVYKIPPGGGGGGSIASSRPIKLRHEPIEWKKAPVRCLVFVGNIFEIEQISHWGHGVLYAWARHLANDHL